MIRVLVVDDDESKTSAVRDVIVREIGESDADVTIAESVFSAVDLMRGNQIDLLVVDMNLPARNDDKPNEDGGIKLLRQVARGTNGLKRPTAVVGLTAYETLASNHLKEFHQHGWALVTYSPTSSEWEAPIAHQCRQVVEIRSRYAVNADENMDVCICTALAEPELSAVSSALGEATGSCSIEGDSTRYKKFIVPVGGKSIRVLIASASEMGVAASAVLTSNILIRFRPRLMILAGICAGMKAEIGDLVVAESSLNYESGKWTEDEVEREAIFAPAPRYLNASPGFVAAIREFWAQRKADIGGLATTYQGDTPKVPEIRIGPVACGGAVIESKVFVKSLLGENRKLEGLEMESYGFYLACRNAYPTLEYGMVKAVCDKGVPPKTDKFQRYAAYLSARVIRFFIEFEGTVDGGMLR